MKRQDPNNYWEQLERLEKLIRASELKAGVLFSFHSLILGLFAERLDFFEPMFQGNWLFTAFTGIWLLCVLTSVYYCFKCFMPRMELKYDDNVFFFRDAVKAFGNSDEYTKRLIDICGSEEELYTQLAEQIHAESKIIANKFGSVQKSLRFFALSFIFAILSLIIGIIQIAS
ncbi:Pycsar system effector family protein [uncultured Muriicola sp.]|uniref:Pycsar system effector family protein n=1 Tax=uncultured Muriicola sp. TaxID=1583102 RepID=UPI0026330367|nr:Pycsar system effector family protein [uncultured Muriicola sp.]